MLYQRHRVSCSRQLPNRQHTSLGLAPSRGGRSASQRQVVCNASSLVLATLNIGELFQGVGSLMPGEMATVFSACIALGSVSLNLWGNVLSERKRAELQKDFMRERLAIESQSELRSVVARYRGPLLESCVDLEQRIYHLITMTGEWGDQEVVCEEEIIYTLFTMAQFLGFVEVVRREGPRENSFLQQGNPQGTDTLNCLVEGFRFAMAAYPDALQGWWDEGEGREHPGCRRRTPITPQSLPQRASQPAAFQYAMDQEPAEQVVMAGGGGSGAGWSDQGGITSSGGSMPTLGSSGGNGTGTSGQPGNWVNPRVAALDPDQRARYEAVLGYARQMDARRRVITPDGLTNSWTPSPSQHCIATASGVFDTLPTMDDMSSQRPETDTFRISRGCQRSLGSMMITTPVGASRHYTLSYAEFYVRFRSDPYFSGWFKPVYEDLLSLVASGERWCGTPAFPINRWTRLLILQQLLIDAIDLLDPLHVRVPENRRMRLAPFSYGQLPNLEAYRKKLETLESLGPPAGSSLDEDQASRNKAAVSLSAMFNSLRGSASPKPATAPASLPDTTTGPIALSAAGPQVASPYSGNLNSWQVGAGAPVSAPAAQSNILSSEKLTVSYVQLHKGTKAGGSEGGAGSSSRAGGARGVPTPAPLQGQASSRDMEAALLASLAAVDRQEAASLAAQPPAAAPVTSGLDSKPMASSAVGMGGYDEVDCTADGRPYVQGRRAAMPQPQPPAPMHTPVPAPPYQQQSKSYSSPGQPLKQQPAARTGPPAQGQPLFPARARAGPVYPGAGTGQVPLNHVLHPASQWTSAGSPDGAPVAGAAVDPTVNADDKPEAALKLLDQMIMSNWRGKRDRDTMH